MTQRGQSVSVRVIQTVASEAGTDPMDLQPLFETIDPDALDILIQTLSDGEITFTYAGYTITVDSTGTVELADHKINNRRTDRSGTVD